MSEEGVTNHQPIDVDEEQEFLSGEYDPDEDMPDAGESLVSLQEAWVPTEAEKDAAQRANRRPAENLVAAFAERPDHYAVERPAPAAGKQPRRGLLAEYLDERPDLAGYFDEFPYEIPDLERIKICRAYASYLAALQPPKPAAKKRQRK